jgi:Uma2 family endonuclease
MTSIPFTEQDVAGDCLVLNIDKVGLSDEQFVALCADNRELHLELTAQKELVIMTLPGGKTGLRNDIICRRLGNWAEKDGKGITFAPLTLFMLPNGARRAPDAAWLRREKWDALTDEQKESIPPLCPDFVVELMSPSDRRPVRFRMIQAKMAEYIENGAQLGWLVDPFEKKVYVYRPHEPVQCLESPSTLYGDPILPGFAFQISEIWQLLRRARKAFQASLRGGAC